MKRDPNSDEINDLPSLSVRRPILVLVLNLLIVLAGIAAVMAVEIRELPNVDRPIVAVFAEYPGASPETMDAEVVHVHLLDAHGIIASTDGPVPKASFGEWLIRSISSYLGSERRS